MKFNDFYREPIGIDPAHDHEGDFADDGALFNKKQDRRRDSFYHEIPEFHSYPWEMTDWS